MKAPNRFGDTVMPVVPVAMLTVATPPVPMNWAAPALSGELKKRTSSISPLT